jgi:hypothetical protein
MGKYSEAYPGFDTSTTKHAVAVAEKNKVRGPRHRPVIASAAKQSQPPRSGRRRDRHGAYRRLAMQRWAFIAPRVGRRPAGG